MHHIVVCSLLHLNKNPSTFLDPKMGRGVINAIPLLTRRLYTNLLLPQEEDLPLVQEEDHLWADFGLLLAPLGSLWGALGLPLAVLWGPFGRLGAPLGPTEPHWVPGPVLGPRER